MKQIMKPLIAILLLMLPFVSCTSPVQQEVRAPIVPPSTNLELTADSVMLELLPIKDSYLCLYKGVYVVMVEAEIHSEDSIDSVWVKIAHSQEAQGWLRESELLEAFVPVNYISQAIYLFSRTYLPYGLLFLSFFLGIYSFRLYRRKQILLVYINDIDSLYPLSLCLAVAVSATLYESIQHFAPDMWQYYFFNPTLSPFDVPPLLSFFLLSLWMVLLLGLATLDVVFRQLSPSEAFFYLLGLLSACILGFLFFGITTRYYIGYVFLVLLFFLFIRQAKQINKYTYRCGECGTKLKSKGICPRCGVLNK